MANRRKNDEPSFGNTKTNETNTRNERCEITGRERPPGGELFVAQDKSIILLQARVSSLECFFSK